MIVRCFSVRLQSLKSISDKAYKAMAFDGSKAILPKSQVFSRDWDVTTSEAYWISAWILDKKGLQYSHKKEAFIDSESGKILPSYTIEKHIPEKHSVVTNYIDSLHK